MAILGTEVATGYLLQVVVFLRAAHFTTLLGVFLVRSKDKQVLYKCMIG